MTSRRNRRLSLALSLAAFLVPAHARPACVVARQAIVPLTMVAGVPVVSLQVNNVTLPFVLDTGSQRSLITEAAVQRADVHLDEWASTTVKGVSGYERHRNADAASLRLGNITLRRRTVAADQVLTVGPLPLAALAGNEIAGLLGTDFLGGFDLDLDLPHRRMALYRVTGCDGQLRPWPAGDGTAGAEMSGYDTIVGSQPIRDSLIIPVQLDGRPLGAEIDSGSTISLLTTSGIDRMGLTPDVLVRDPEGSVHGVGRFAVVTRRHRFGVLRVGAEHIANPAIWAAPVHILPIIDILLGEDWLGRHRVWLSYATSRVFVLQGP